jgi:hypothetical protein
MLFVAPALAGLVAVGPPLIGAVFPASVQSSDVATMRAFGALLATWTVAALLVNLLLPAMFALHRARLVNALAVPLILLHIAATAIGGALFGAYGVVGAFFVSPAVFAAVMLRAGATDDSLGLAGLLAADAFRFVAFATVSFGAGAALGFGLSSGIPAAVTAGVVGTVGYAACLRLLAPRQLDVMLAAVRPKTT